MRKFTLTILLVFITLFGLNAQKAKVTHIPKADNLQTARAASSVRASPTKKYSAEGKTVKQNNPKNTKGAIFSENFSSGTLPSGWSNVDNGVGGVWIFNNPKPRTINTTTGVTGIAIFDSDFLGNDGKPENSDYSCNRLFNTQQHKAVI